MKLEKGLLSPKLGGEILDSLEADNKRAATIVKSLRSIFADDDSYAQRVEVELLISNVLSVVNPHLKSRNIQMQLKVQEGLQILVSPSEIEQVILNLINNSIQSLDSSKIAKGVIALVAKQDGRYVNISISDNGSGVPAEFKQHLFELLNTTKQSGMGLGLWLCRHLLTRLGGTIWYENAKGGGAKFNFKIPLAP
jgi:signal transduction histidine kinase